jgi:hypothetical protein
MYALGYMWQNNLNERLKCRFGSDNSLCAIHYYLLAYTYGHSKAWKPLADYFYYGAESLKQDKKKAFDLY